MGLANRLLIIGSGYIGSYLCQSLSNSGHIVDVCDHNPERVSPLAADVINSAYQDLSIEQLSRYKSIIWLAGHSSVGAAQIDPSGAVANNCIDLYELTKKLKNQRFLYASTASVYSEHLTPCASAPKLRTELQTILHPANPYDSSKIAFDALSIVSEKNTTGMRFGTVSGFSPQLRTELIFNAMNLSAIREECVKVANQNAFRSILFLADLAEFVERLLLSAEALPKIVNMASCNIRVGTLAEKIAAFYNVPLIEQANSVTYSFQMDMELLSKTSNFVPVRSIEDHCLEFKQNA